MDLQLIGFTSTTLGEILIGFTVIRVHEKMTKEHEIDKVVIQEMRREKKATQLGILLITVGFVLQLMS